MKFWGWHQNMTLGLVLMLLRHLTFSSSSDVPLVIPSLGKGGAVLPLWGCKEGKWAAMAPWRPGMNKGKG